MPCRWFRLHASMKRLIGNRAAVFDVTLHYKHRDALAVAREHKRLIWFLKADLPAMNVQGKDHCLICNFISALDGNSSVVLTDNPSVELYNKFISSGSVALEIVEIPRDTP